MPHYRLSTGVTANQFGSPSATTRPGLWIMNTKLLEAKNITNRFQQEWTRCRLQERKYPDTVMWWQKYLKRKIRFLFIQEGSARTREEMINENLYYACIYDIMKYRRHHREKTPTLKLLKAEIVRLHSKRVPSITIDTQEVTLFQEKGRPFSISYRCGNGVCRG